jgi:hypothetical protein
MEVKVIDHEPQLWFLLQDADKLLFDVGCEHGAVGYSVLIELTPTEAHSYENEGHDYLMGLSEAIQNSAPGVRGSLSPYKDRNIQSVRGQEVLAAVLASQGRQVSD